ncbi:acyltransferase family protein [Flagellimonas sp.]|uniref:acyltransferase family protein n=1 Tax=Flagellimonas sp. TaxID=2058762 RepID=UPI003BB1B6A9
MGQPSKRILSIDALRGFDMLLIIFADHFFYNLHQGGQTPFTEALAKQFSHPEWFGSTFYDIIMPLFLFVVGAVIPFSMSKRMQDKNGKGHVYRKLAKRFVILFVLGWIVQGNLLAFDLSQFHVFSNTLQAIAVGYLFSCLAYIHLNQKWRYVVFAACLVVYALLLTVPNVPGVGQSVLLPDQNFALYFDRLILGRFDDGLQYTWLLSGLGFTATTLSGVFAGELIKSKLPRNNVALYLFIAGIVGLALGLIWGIWHPIVKKIWSSSFVLASSGVCFLLLALFYLIIDVKGRTKWTYPLKVIGMNAITAYVLSHVINFPEVSKFLLFGLERSAGSYYPMLTSIGGFGILYLLLWYMYKNNTFIKV